MSSRKENEEPSQEKEDVIASQPTENKLIMRMVSSYPQDWDRKAPRYCILRIAQVQINRVALLRPMNPAYHHFHFAAGIQGSKRTVLRSDQIALPKDGPKLMDSPVDLLLSMYYLHNLKSQDNVLELALRKRRRGRNKLIGLAYLSLDELLQVSFDGVLDFVDANNEEDVVARIDVVVSSLPAEAEHIETVELRDEELEDHDEIDALEVARDAGIQTSRFTVDTDSDGSSSEPDLFSDDMVEQNELDLLQVPDKAGQDQQDSMYEEDGEEERDEETLQKKYKPQRAMRQIIKRRIGPSAVRMRERVAKLRIFRGSAKGENEVGDSVRERDSSVEPIKTEPIEQTEDPIEIVSRSPKSEEPDEVPETEPLPQISPPTLLPSPRLTVSRSHSDASGDTQDETHSTSSAKNEDVIRRLDSGGVMFGPTDEEVADTSLDHSVCLVQSSAQPGKLLLSWSQTPASISGFSWGLRGRCVGVSTPLDVQNSLGNAWSEYTSTIGKSVDTPPPLRVVIAFVSDSFLHTILRGLVERGGHRRVKLPPIEISFSFFLLPLKGESSIVSQIVSARDVKFRSLFFSPNWTRFFERECIDEQLGKEIETRTRLFVTGAHHVHQMPLGEVLITYKQESKDELTQLTLPFVGSIEIGYMPSGIEVPGEKGADESGSSPPKADAMQLIEEEEKEKLTIDYWELSKEVSKESKEKKKTVKAIFHLVSLRLAKGKSHEDEDQEEAKEFIHTMELQAVYSDRTLGVKALGRRLGLKSGDKVGSDSIKTKITKLVCSVPEDCKGGFAVLVDGTEFKSVRLVSISRIWHGVVKSFPIAGFAE